MPWEGSLVHSGFREHAVQHAIQGWATQNMRVEYLEIIQTWRLLLAVLLALVLIVHRYLSTRGDWWLLTFTQGLIPYTVVAHYLFNLHSLSGMYNILYHLNKKTRLWVVHSVQKCIENLLSDDTLGTGDKIVSRTDKIPALSEFAF